MSKFEISGLVGDALRAVTDQWLLVAPYANPAMLEMFSDRDVLPYRDLGPWAGEFAGKYLTAAVQVYQLTGDPRLYATLSEFVPRLLARQDTDGYLGPWPETERLTNQSILHGEKDQPYTTWDTWGHYHIMLGLLLWHETSGDPQALSAARRIADLVCRKYLGDKRPRLVDTGMTEMNLAPVHALALLYRKTGHADYLAMAEQIVQEFNATRNGVPLAGDYLNTALEGKPFYQCPRPRWESLHPILGLVELYWATGKESYRQAFEHIWWSIQKYDRHNNGAFSSGEQATGNPYATGTMETCCTIAWIALSVEMLKLTGDPRVADEIEWSTLNAVLGMHARSGRWATFSTLSDGMRCASFHQIGFQSRPGSPELNCCTVNSPRGLGLVSDWALLQSSQGVFLNFYAPSRLTADLPGGESLVILQETAYPLSGCVKIHLIAPRSARLPLHFRIPGWSENTRVVLNNQRIAAPAGAYLSIERAWDAQDALEINFDLRPRTWKGANECQGLTSLYVGPLLLAYDQRYNRHLSHARPHGISTYGRDALQIFTRQLAVPPLNWSNLQLTPARWDDWLPPHLLYQTIALDGSAVFLCDFASAGQTGSLYRSWLP